VSSSLRPYPPTVGPYRVLRPLGRGGAAVVYEVEHPSTGERIALKLLTHQLSAVRFEREYRTLASLTHPNIVRVYEFGFTDDQYPYLTMELLDGVPAQAHAKACGRPGGVTRTAEVVRIGALVAEALEYLHQNRIVHRDLKSSNVLILADGSVKLLDLGTARLLGSTEGITRQGEFIGTFTYASPEQLTGQTVDHRSDIYSLGVLLYRLLTGRRPFEVEDPHELARLHIEAPPAPLTDIAPSLPASLADYVLQLLAKRPDQRPRSARLVADYLQQSGLGAAPLSLGPPWAGELPLVGRAGETARVEAMLSRAHPGDMMVLTGPAGSGRSRMLREAVRLARERGLHGYQAAFPGPTGLGALTPIAWDITRELRREGPTDPSFATLRDAAPAPPASTRLVLFLELASLIRKRSGPEGQAVLLALEHLELARPLALQAIAALRSRAVETDLPLIILATTEAPDGELPSMIRRSFPDARALPMSRLDTPAIGKLVSAMLSTDAPAEALAQRLQDATSGWPGYLEGLVRAGVRAGARARGRLALPPSVSAALTVHLQNLSRVCGRVWEALAAIGGDAPVELLAHVSGLPMLELRAGLLALQREGLLEQMDDGGVETWRFRLHTLAMQTATTMPGERAEELRQRVASGLATAPPTAAKIRLLVSSRHLEPALSEAAPWAERWLDDGQPAEVLHILAPLIDRIDEIEGAPAALRARVLLCFARALSAVDPDDSRSDRALALAMGLATEPVRQAEVDLHTADLYRRRGQIDRARARLARANRLVDQGQAPRVRALARLQRGTDALERGDAGTAGVCFDEARRYGERAGDLRTTARARLGLATLALHRGELEEAERELSRCAASMTRSQDDPGQWAAAVALAATLRLEGRLSEARQTLTRHREAARLTGHQANAAEIMAGQAEIELDLGRVEEALRLLPSSAESIDTLASPAIFVVARVRARALHVLDRREDALDALEPALALARAQGMLGHAARLMAWKALFNMDSTERRLELDAVRTALEPQGDVPAMLELALVLGLACASRGQPIQTLPAVERWAGSQPARLYEWQMAWLSLRRALVLGDPQAIAEQREHLNAVSQKLEALLEPSERDALRAHVSRQDPSPAQRGGRARRG